MGFCAEGGSSITRAVSAVARLGHATAEFAVFHSLRRLRGLFLQLTSLTAPAIPRQVALPQSLPPFRRISFNASVFPSLICFNSPLFSSLPERPMP
jgi:hypothetical protein